MCVKCIVISNINITKGVPFVEDTIHGGCNTDIQLHINKGVIGLRIDNVVGFEINDINIHDLKNTGTLGHETICGAYAQGNAHQDPLITAGYTGTEGYGITITQSQDGTINNARIDNIETHFGHANGIALFKDSIVDFNAIEVSNIIAGSQIELTDLRPYQAYLPNKIPKACSVYDNNYNTAYTIGEGGVNGNNINGYLTCNAIDNNLIGDCQNDDFTDCAGLYGQTYFDELALTYDTPDKFRAFIASKQESITINNQDYMPYIVGSIILLVLFVFIIYYKQSFVGYQKVLIKSISKSDISGNEYTPLLN